MGWILPEGVSRPEDPADASVSHYHWLKYVWKADAVIHMGTHGNLEWLPGKGVGLDEESYPDIALGDIPNIYPYHMTITGEGMIAKRRASAQARGELHAGAGRRCRCL